MKTLFTLAALSFACVAANAQTPVGIWETIDDTTKKPRSHVRIVEENGVLTGVVIKGLDPNDKPDAVCELCTDERKGKPIIGMTIIRNLKRDGDKWTGGDVLDPKNGKVYRAQISLPDKKTLVLRGYIGTPLLGRSQTWSRVE
jgi:uncharacterized protein (DUF2147 family)